MLTVLRGRRRVIWWPVAALTLAFVGLNAILLARAGVRIGGDTGRYTDGADRLLAGLPLESFQWAYTAYIVVIAAVRGLGGDLAWVVGVQIVAAAIAGLALWSLGNTLGGPGAGLAAAAFALLNPEIVQWHAYILTDSLYASAVIFGAWAAWRAMERRGLAYAAALLVLIPAWFLRLTGVVLLPATGAVWAFWGVLRRQWRSIAIGVATAGGAVVLLLAMPPIRGRMERAPLYLLLSGSVFYRTSLHQVQMPASSPADGQGWGGYLRYAARNPGPTLTLVTRRVAVELAHVRPHYSRGHNAIIVAILLPLYLLAVAGIAVTWRHPLTHLLLGLIGAHLALVAITLADYDGRFLAHILGPIGVFAGAGLAAVTRRVATVWTGPAALRPSRATRGASR